MLVIVQTIPFKWSDGGRVSAGYKGKAGDCVTRAVAIAAELPYQVVYDKLAMGNAEQRQTKHSRKRQACGSRTALHGIWTKRKWFKDYLTELGFTWFQTMGIGTGCKVHVRSSELPSSGRLLLRLSKHYAAFIDGTLMDTYDCSRNGTRCVYGYWLKQQPTIGESSYHV